MSLGSFDKKGAATQAVFEINMVPLIDVMLVLLVIFIITAPLLAHSIRIDLPRVSAEQIDTTLKTIDLAIDATGAIFWDEEPVAVEDLPHRFTIAATGQPQPEVRIRADLDTRYKTLAQVMAAARRSGLVQIGFLTNPSSSDGISGQGR
jgi:biopolymer transport protein ExbD